MTMTMSRIIYNNQRKRECERTLAALPTNMGVMINKHATERPECKPTLTCVGVYTNLGSANLGWCPFEIERPSVFVLVLRYTWHHLTSPWNRIPRHAQANAFYDGLLAHLLIVPAWVIPPGDCRMFLSCFCHGKSNFGGVDNFRSKSVKFGDQPPYNTIYIRCIPHKTA